MKVTKDFEKTISKNPALKQAFETAADRAMDNPGLIREKTNLPGIYSLDLPGGQRALLAKNADGELVPFFVGSHADYDKVLKKNPDVDSALKKVIESSKIDNEDLKNFGHIGAALGHKGGSAVREFINKLGNKTGIIGGLVVGAATFLKTGDAEAALEQATPFAPSVIAAMDDKEIEAALLLLEETGIGSLATEVLRPLIREFRDPGSVEPGIIEDALKALQEHLSENEIKSLPEGVEDHSNNIAAILPENSKLTVQSSEGDAGLMRGFIADIQVTLMKAKDMAVNLFEENSTQPQNDSLVAQRQTPTTMGMS